MHIQTFVQGRHNVCKLVCEDDEDSTKRQIPVAKSLYIDDDDKVFDDEEEDLTRRRMPVAMWRSQMTVFSTSTSQWGEEQNLVMVMFMMMLMVVVLLMMISSNTSRLGEENKLMPYSQVSCLSVTP